MRGVLDEAEFCMVAMSEDSSGECHVRDMRVSYRV